MANRRDLKKRINLMCYYLEGATAFVLLCYPEDYREKGIEIFNRVQTLRTDTMSKINNCYGERGSKIVREYYADLHKNFKSENDALMEMYAGILTDYMDKYIK
ncbi:MAG: hypothetical protein ACRC6R_02080 [Bacteroidales bacterium]